MINKIKFNQSILITFFQVLLIYLGFWFLLNSLSTDGVWETVVLSVLFFFILPGFLFKKGNLFKKNKELKEWLVWSQVFLISLLFLFFVLLGGNVFLKLNYLARVDFFTGDWWAIFFLDLFLIPIILFSQEFFFRGFLMEKFGSIFSLKTTLIIQASLFVVFEMLFFETFTWQFVLFNFFLALFLGFLYDQTKSIWYSFAVRWFLILILDGSILYTIQQLKS